MSNMFSGDIWTCEELKSYLKKLEEMYANGVRDSTFKDQRISFPSAQELEQRITVIRRELDRRGSLNDSVSGSGKPKKIIRVTTRRKGF